jgi:hypothetical protein
MPGDPKECRLHAMYCMELFLHAMNCMELVEDTANPEMRRIFFDLAHRWNRIANELEDTQVRLDALIQLQSASADLGVTRSQAA